MKKKGTPKKPKYAHGEGGWTRLEDPVELQGLASSCRSVAEMLRTAGIGSVGGSQVTKIKRLALGAGVTLPVSRPGPQPQNLAPVADPRKAEADAQKAIANENAELRRQVEALSTQVKLSKQREQVSVHDWYGKKAKIGVLGDTHLGNKFHNPQLLKAAYKTFKREGCEAVYNPGDVCDGQNMYKGQEYELYAFGFDAQVNEVVENYPCEADMPTYYILGNHDLSFWKELGADFGEAVGARRPDLICIGRSEHDVKIGRIIMRLSHPSGGTAYAISYRTQKAIDSFSGGEKPHVLLVGHFHKMEHLFYRNVHAFQVGTIQSQTDFMRGKPTPAIMGFWILTIHHNAKGVARVECEWYPYYEPEKRTT